MHPDRIKTIQLAKEPKKQGWVVYWMQQSQRVHGNHALAYAIKRANELAVPLVVFFQLYPSFPNANLRHYWFMLEGLLEVQRELEERKIAFVFEVDQEHTKLLQILENAIEAIFDHGYSEFQRNIRNLVYSEGKSRNMDLTIHQVESDLVVPIEQASNKLEYGAYTIRKKLMSQVEDYRDNPTLEEVAIDARDILPNARFVDICWARDQLKVDKGVQPSMFFKGGYLEAIKRLEDFTEYQLEHYLESSDPSKDGSSKLSMYLHFGQISSLEILERLYNHLEHHPEHQLQVDAFIEQLIVRRELAFNYIYYNRGYRHFETMTEPWAYLTMKEHEQDPRPMVYSLEELEHAKTHDPYFNAAMDEMVYTGYMQNTMRMYWGKKIIEWTPTHQEAYKRIVYLNDKYFIDGRDANSYAGIAWLFGKHDRAWTERPIFGKLRYMNDKGLIRKYEIDEYVKQVETLKRQALEITKTKNSK